MIKRKWLISPLRIIIVVFGIQYIMWLLFFPEIPTLPFGEPKSQDLSAQMLFRALFLVFCLAIFIGQFSSGHSNLNRSYSYSQQDHNYFYNVGRAAFWIGTVAMIIQLRIFILEPNLIYLLREPHGQNQLARMMHQNSPAGVPTLSWLMVVALAVFSLYWFSLPTGYQRKKYAIRYIILAMLLLLFFSVLGMSRQALFVGIILIMGAWSMAGAGRLRLKIGPVSIVILMLIIFVFVGSAIRMAGTEGAFSPMVYESAWAEFVEKYIPGELNNAFILLSYPTDISSNWLYATMFSQFNDSSFIPPRYLYTMNNLAIWYWQFGGRSFLVATVIGLLIGGTYGAAKRSQFVLGWSSIFYLVFLPAIYTMIRVNAFFLHYFVVPIIFLTGARILWLVLRSFPARKRAVTRKWENTGPAELQDHPG